MNKIDKQIDDKKDRQMNKTDGQIDIIIDRNMYLQIATKYIYMKGYVIKNVQQGLSFDLSCRGRC